ncbi:hypothetical protein ACI2LO_34965, partial [Streptomyces sp. NPDC033754]
MQTITFAGKLPETAAELYVTDASDAGLAAAEKLPASSIDAEFYELEAGRHVPPDRVWSAWLCGDHLVTERREVLRQFANGIDVDNRRVHRAFLASLRVLGEGVDITGERGVEAICFVDTRGSQVEIVQNIGRALRLNKDGSTKVARIIVPVFLEPNEDPTDMVASASFRPLVAILQGLRSHDDRLVEQLASRALTRGKRKVHVRRDEDGGIVGAGGAGDGEDQDDSADGRIVHCRPPHPIPIRHADHLICFPEGAPICLVKPGEDSVRVRQLAVTLHPAEWRTRARSTLQIPKVPARAVRQPSQDAPKAIRDKCGTHSRSTAKVHELRKESRCRHSISRRRRGPKLRQMKGSWRPTSTHDIPPA